jgi:putative ABC transport system permease protein
MLRLFGLIRLALRRLLSQPGLAACVLLGMTIAVAFASALPAFVNSSQLRVLRKLLISSTGRDANATNPAERLKGTPLHVRFSYVSGLGGPLTLAQLSDLDGFMRSRIQPRTVVPVSEAGTYIRTDRWNMWPAPGTRTGERYTPKKLPLSFASMTAMNGFEQHIRLEEGVMPANAPKDGTLPTLVHTYFADKHGIQAGDVFSLTMEISVRDPKGAGRLRRIVEQRATIVGVWAPVNPDDDFWFVSPFSFSDGFMITRDTFEQDIAQLLPEPVAYVVYNYNLDETQLQTELVPALLTRIGTLRDDVFTKRSGMAQATNVSSILQNYVKASGEMTLLMVAFAAPLFVIVFYFIVLVSGMVVQRQETELIMLRSRGASTGDALGLYAIQSALIGLLALLIGMPLGYLIGALMTGIRTFLDLSGLVQLSIGDFLTTFSPQFLPFRFALGAAFLATLATMLPAAGASRSTIVLGSAERGRSSKTPVWQRMFLDLLLLIPVGYGYMQLEQQGNIGLFGRTLSNENPLRDPVRYLLPMLLMTSLALLLARLFPLLMRAFAFVFDKVDSRVPFATPLLLSARELERSPRSYLGSLLLLVMATGIATFGASTAKTLDGHLRDSVYFQTGADLRLEENAQSSKPQATAGPGQAAQRPPDDGKPEIFSFLPPEDHLTIDGVRAYSRMATLSVRPEIARRIGEFSIRAIDYYNAARVIRKSFREDFASKPFGTLMNTFSEQPDALIVTPIFLKLNNKNIGEQLMVRVQLPEGPVPVTYTIAGTYENFPTIEPKEDQFVFIADMDYTFEKMGKAVPYDVLLELAPGASGTAVSNRANQMGYMVTQTHDARFDIQEAQQTPERQGLFGILTTGFFASITLTIIGFVLYAVLSFRRRAIEFGVLRTLGLSQGQMATYLFASQLIIVLTGTAAGAGAGILAGRLFIPFFQVTGKLVAEVPAFYVRMAWTELIAVCALIGAAFIVAIVIMFVFMRRMKAFEAVKLGAEM